jgi:hypothetical protein
VFDLQYNKAMNTRSRFSEELDEEDVHFFTGKFKYLSDHDRSANDAYFYLRIGVGNDYYIIER